MHGLGQLGDPEALLPARLAGRLAAVLYMGVAGAVILLNAILPDYSSADRRAMALAGATLIVIGLALWRLPWQRWPRRALLLIIPLSMTTMAGYNLILPLDPYHYELFALPIFGWIGLACRRGTALAALPLLAPTYLLPLAVTGRLSRDSAVALIYVAIFCAMQGEGLAWLMARLAAAQRAVEASEARYRALSEQASDIISVIDTQGRFTYVSPSARTIMGLNPDALLGTSFFDILHPDDHVPARDRLERGATTPVEIRIRHADGSWRWLEHTIKDARHEPLIGGFLATGRDISERKREELERERLLVQEQEVRQRAEQAETRLRTIVEASPLPILTMDLAGGVRSWNGAAERTFGWREEEVLGVLLPLVAPEEQASFADMLARLVQGELLPALEGRGIRKDGAVIDLQIFTAPLRDADGRISGIMAVDMDITARKQADRALERASAAAEELARLRQDQAQAAETMAEVSVALGSALGLKDLYTLILQQTGKILPLDHAQILVPDEGWLTVVAQHGAPPVEIGTRLFHVSQAPSNWRRLQHGRPVLIRDTMEDPEWVDIPPRVGPHRLRCLLSIPLMVDGNLMGVFEVTSTTRNCYDARHIQIATAFGDRITQALRNVRLFEAEQQRARAAEDLARLRSDFVASVSHELRTPLTGILGFAELLQAHWARLPDTRKRDQIDRIVQAANRQLRLVEDLLLLSRQEDGQPVVQARPIQIGALVRRAATELQGSYAEQPIELDGPEDLSVVADPDRTMQILLNLLDNAAKYSPDESPIAVSWGWEDVWAVVRVRDHGPGLPEEGRERLFSQFGRLAGSRMRAGRVGTGLGLYLGRRLARAMGGDLDLETTGPEGSIFRLSLPVEASPEPIPQASLPGPRRV